MNDELDGNVLEDEQKEDADGEMESADELEQKLLDAMRSLTRKNKMVEEYLENLAETGEKQPAGSDQPQNEASSG